MKGDAKFAPLSLTADEIVEFTPLWTGPRHADGRPRVDDATIARLKKVSLTQAWAVLANHGYRSQYEGGWQRTHADKSLCGRALTAAYMPKRTDLADVIFSKAEAAGQVGDLTSWPIYALQTGDVYVADVFGKVEWGPVIGDNLSTAISMRTGTGTVQNAAVRDIEGIEKVNEFPVFCRGQHPTYANPTVVMIGINCPVRLGAVTVLPGDVVLGKSDGLLFIPPHLAETVASTCEIVTVRDIFAKQRMKEGTYLHGQIDRKWSDEIETDFFRWLKENPGLLPMTDEEIRGYLGGRLW